MAAIVLAICVLACAGMIYLRWRQSGRMEREDARSHELYLRAQGRATQQGGPRR